MAVIENVEAAAEVGVDAIKKVEDAGIHVSTGAKVLTLVGTAVVGGIIGWCTRGAVDKKKAAKAESGDDGEHVVEGDYVEVPVDETK